MGIGASRLGYSRAQVIEEGGVENPEERIDVPNNVQPPAVPAEDRSMFSLYFGTTQLFNLDAEEEIFGFRDENGEVDEEASTTVTSLNSVANSVTVKSPVNLLKTSLQLIPKEEGSNIYFLQFNFDATSSGTVKIFVTHSETSEPKEIAPAFSFEKGLGQTFTNRDAPICVQDFSESVLEFNESMKVSPIKIVIDMKDLDEEKSKAKKVTSQTTTAALIKCGDNSFEIKPIKQSIQYGGTTYVVHDIYGIDQNTTTPPDECVICMTEIRDTVVIPCRHMCVCHQCAQVLRYQSNKCPICRGPVRSMIKIKISKKVEDVESESSQESKKNEIPLKKLKKKPTVALLDSGSDDDSVN